MLRILQLSVFSFVLCHCTSVLAQNESRSIGFYAGISSNAPVFGVKSEDYNLKFDSKYPWISASIGIEKFLPKTEKSTFNFQLNYQPLPHSSMSLTQSESLISGVYTREFDSLIMKSNNFRLSIGVKHYFKQAYDGIYVQYNAGLNLIFNQSSICSCTRIESEEDNYYSETGTYSSEKRKLLFPDLSFSMGYAFPISDQFAIDTGIDVGMPFGKLKYPYLLQEFPLASQHTRLMNLNGLFLTSLIEIHAKVLFIK